MFLDGFKIDDHEPWRKVENKYPMVFKPCFQLEPYISCYWLSVFTGTKDEAQRLKPRTVTLIPDGGSSIVFDINYVRNWHSESIWGVMDKPVVVYNQHSISKGEIMTFGVDFKPGGLYRFLSIPMKEFANQSPDLRSVSQSIFHELSVNVVNARSIREQIHIIESFLLKMFYKTDRYHPSISGALQVINETSGDIRVGELADRLLISERSLNRLFHEHIGLSPKALCRITRLQRVIKLCMEDNQMDILLTAYDSGYFDQSHFIKDFKEFCGCTPGEFKKRG